MSYGVGIDLGMSFTGAAIDRDGHPRMVTLGEKQILVPTVVRIQPDGSLASGDSNQPDLEVDPGRTARDFKRRLGDPTPLILGGQQHSAVSLLAATLSSVVSTITRLEGEPPGRVALTYPAVWGPYRREQFNEVPRRAGLDPDVVTILTEPEAASAYYAAQQNFTAGDLIAVYDLGGGTFDTTITRVKKVGPGEAAQMEILGAPEGIEWVGGVDFDDTVLAYVDKALGGVLEKLDPHDPAAVIALHRIRRQCIRAKENLSRHEVTDIVVPLPEGHALVRLTRPEFESMIHASLEATLAALDRAMKSAGLTAAELSGILLVGGSSRIPLVAKMLSASLGRPVLVDRHPQYCVALGAATVARRESLNRGVSPPPVPEGIPPRKTTPWRRVTGARLVAATAGAAVLIGVGAFLVSPGWFDFPRSQAPEARVGTAFPDTAATAVESLTSRSVSTPSADPNKSPDAKKSTDPKKSTRSPSRASPATSVRSGPAQKPRASHAPRPPAAVSPLSGFVGEVIGVGGKCMDLANAQPSDGAIVQIFTCNASSAQEWNGGSHDSLRNYGECLTASSPDAAGGGNQVLLRTCNGSASQGWQVKKSALVNKGSSLCLSTVGSQSADRTFLVVKACNDSADQEWRLAG